MSSAYHPEMDGAVTVHKTVTQALQYHVDRHQKGWVKGSNHLVQYHEHHQYIHWFLSFPTADGSFTRIYTSITHRHWFDGIARNRRGASAVELMTKLALDTAEAWDKLVCGESQQADSPNWHCAPEIPFAVGDKVLLSRRTGIMNTYKRSLDVSQNYASI